MLLQQNIKSAEEIEDIVLSDRVASELVQPQIACNRGRLDDCPASSPSRPPKGPAAGITVGQ